MRVPALLFAFAMAACSSAPAERTRVAGLIRDETMYSAFETSHEYRVVVTVLPGVVREVILDQDPDSRIDWTSVRFTTDSAFVEQDDYPWLAGAALLTTKRAGKTRIAVSFETTAGVRLQSEATLVISAASSDEWEAGDAHFNRTSPIVPPPPENRGACGIPETVELPTTKACPNCHDPRQALARPLTPFELAHQSDDELIAALADGILPAGGFGPNTFIDAVRRSGGDVACVFSRMHDTDEVDEQTARGVLWKLRSLAPVVPKDFDPELRNDVKPDSGL